VAMLAFSCSILLATLPSILRSRAALELENLPCGPAPPNRHAVENTLYKGFLGCSFLLLTSVVAPHECVSLTWVAMYHVFPNASSTAALRSPYGCSAGS
jgi:hypothetical protein